MGLDMYLFRQKKKKLQHDNLGRTWSGNDAEQVCYWRKANQVRGYIMSCFLEEEIGGDTCGILTKENLMQIVNDINIVINENNELVSKELAMDLFPPTQGFFFGSNEIDDMYVGELVYTRNAINEILNTTNFDTDAIVYEESW